MFLHHGYQNLPSQRLLICILQIYHLIYLFFSIFVIKTEENNEINVPSHKDACSRYLIPIHDFPIHFRF